MSIWNKCPVETFTEVKVELRLQVSIGQKNGHKAHFFQFFTIKTPMDASTARALGILIVK